MRFHGPIVRPQTDAYSLFIELTVGCTHNSCTFCNFYEGYPFRMIPLSEIEKNLKEAKKLYPNEKRIWASGGNPYALSTEKLAEIGKLFKKYYPNAKVSTYARVDDLCRKTVDEMRYLKKLGFGDLLIGIESGDDVVLKNTNKGYSAADILEGCKKLEEADVDYRIIYLGGLAGKGHGVESAHKSAKILNQLHPYLMYLTTVSVLPGTKLYQERQDGLFIEQDEKERLEEFMTLLSEMKNDMTVYSAPNTTRFSFTIDLQKEKKQVIAEMKKIHDDLTDEDEARIQAYRDSMVTV